MTAAGPQHRPSASFGGGCQAQQCRRPAQYGAGSPAAPGTRPADPIDLKRSSTAAGSGPAKLHHPGTSCARPALRQTRSAWQRWPSSMAGVPVLAACGTACSSRHQMLQLCRMPPWLRPCALQWTPRTRLANARQACCPRCTRPPRLPTLSAHCADAGTSSSPA